MLGTLTQAEAMFPMYIFIKDQSGVNSLDFARKEHRYKTFKLFIELLNLCNKENLCTKLMLNCIPYMLRSQNETIYTFFNKCIY